MDGQPTPVRIPRDKIDTIAILHESLARNTDMRKNAEHLSYGHTSLGSNDVGLHGEHATAYFLGECGAQVKRIADDEASRRHGIGDLSVNGFGIEIKTQRERDWKRIGRCVNAKQLRYASYWAVVWCVVENELPTATIDLMGWLPAGEIQAAGGDPVVINDRDYVRVTLPMRPMAELATWLDTTSPFDLF